MQAVTRCYLPKRTLDEKLNLHQVCLVQTCCKHRLCIGLHPLRKWWLPSLHKVYKILFTLSISPGAPRELAGPGKKFYSELLRRHYFQTTRLKTGGQCYKALRIPINGAFNAFKCSR